MIGGGGGKRGYRGENYWQNWWREVLLRFLGAMRNVFKQTVSLQFLLYYSSSIIEDTNYGVIEHASFGQVGSKNFRKTRTVLEKICSPVTKICYTVTDNLDLQRYGFIAKLIV